MPQVVQGAQRMLQDVLTWLLVLIPVAGGTMIAYHSLLKILSDNDPATIIEKNKRIKQVLVGVVVGMSASGLVMAIIGYFT